MQTVLAAGDWSTAVSAVSGALSALAAVFSVTAAIRSLASLRTSRQALRVSEQALDLERHRDKRRQAQHVCAWWGDDHGNPADERAVVFNGSETPIYHVNAVIDNLRYPWQVKEVWSVLPPNTKAGLNPAEVLTGHSADMRVELSFMDSSGTHWLRRRNGPLEALDSKLVVWVDSRRRGALEQTIKADFEQMYQVRLEFADIAPDFRFSDGTPGDLIRDFRQADADRLPDLILVPHDWLGELVESETIEPLLLASRHRDRFLAKTVDAMMYEGIAYGVPFFVDAATLIRREGSSRHRGKVAVQVGRHGDPFQLWPIYSGCGGELFGQDADGGWRREVRLDSAASLTAWHELNQLARSRKLLLGRDTDAAVRSFLAERTDQVIASSSAIMKIRRERPELSFSTQPLPSLNEQHQARSLCSVYGFFLRRDARNKHLAQAFIADYLSRFDVGLEWSRLQPPRLSAQRDAYDSAHQVDGTLATPFLHAFESGILMPAFPQMSRVWDLVGQAQCAVIDAAQDAIDDIVHQLTEDVRAVLGSD